MAEDQFWVGVHGVIARGGKLLVLKRAPSMRYKPGTWDLPGGHLAIGESFEALKNIPPKILAAPDEVHFFTAVLAHVTDPEVAEIAATLPAGRLHASGKGLVPYVKGDLYNELLCATLANQAPEPNPGPSPQDLPRTWDDLAPGHIVIAKETLELGWWEAVVIERTGDLVTVKYRDYPQYPPLVRHRSVIALIGAAAA